MTTKPNMEPDGRSSSLIARAFQAVEFLAEGPQSASDLARRFGTDRSTALRLLRELQMTGYVTRDESTKRYTIVGARFYRLIVESQDHADLSEVVDPILRAIRDEFGEATVLALPALSSMVYAALFPSVHLLGVRERLGTLRPMHCSAVGKAYLSALPTDILANQLAQMSFEGGTENAPHDKPALLREIALAKRTGYATDYDETFVGATCVAVPLSLGESLIGSIGATGPSFRLTHEFILKIGPRLAEAADELRAASLGRVVSL